MKRDDNTFQTQLMVIDNSEKVLLHEVITESASPTFGDTFFIFQNKLVFIKNKTEIKNNA